MDLGTQEEGVPMAGAPVDEGRGAVSVQLADALKQNTAAKVAEKLLADDQLLNELLGP